MTTSVSQSVPGGGGTPGKVNFDVSIGGLGCGRVVERLEVVIYLFK